MSDRWVVKADGGRRIAARATSYYAGKDSPSCDSRASKGKAWIFSRYDALTEANTWGRSWQPWHRPPAPEGALRTSMSALSARVLFPKHLATLLSGKHPPKCLRGSRRPKMGRQRWPNTSASTSPPSAKPSDLDWRVSVNTWGSEHCRPNPRRQTQWLSDRRDQCQTTRLVETYVTPSSPPPGPRPKVASEAPEAHLLPREGARAGDRDWYCCHGSFPRPRSRFSRDAHRSLGV